MKRVDLSPPKRSRPSRRRRVQPASRRSRMGRRPAATPLRADRSDESRLPVRTYDVLRKDDGLHRHQTVYSSRRHPRSRHPPRHQTANHRPRTGADRREKYPEPRPLNLDPGLLLLGKFLLATTKDQSHRIYLRDGIYAEVTLRYTKSEFEPWPWTYADYREPFVHSFLASAREHLYNMLEAERLPDWRVRRRRYPRSVDAGIDSDSRAAQPIAVAFRGW